MNNIFNDIPQVQQFTQAQTISQYYSNLLKTITNFKYNIKQPSNLTTRTLTTNLAILNKIYLIMNAHLQQQQKYNSIADYIELITTNQKMPIKQLIQTYSTNCQDIKLLTQQYRQIDLRAIQQKGRQFINNQIKRYSQQLYLQRQKRIMEENKSSKFQLQINKIQKDLKVVNRQIIDLEIQLRSKQISKNNQKSIKY